MPWIRIEGAAFWICFVAAFLGVALWESFRPERTQTFAPERRWLNHGILLFISAAVMTVLLRITPLALAGLVADSRFGVLNKPWIPFSVRCLAAILLLDLAHYGAHWCFHHVSFLWRVHEVHHSDPDYDVSTAFRFHPLEILFTQGVYLGVVALLAPPVVAVLIAELLTVIVNLLVHANAALPAWAEKSLSTVFVTPDLHRVHHSEEMSDQWNNLGQTFAWWDRLFGTFARTPAVGKERLRIGVKGLQSEKSIGLAFMLAEPFHAAQEPQESPVSQPDLLG